MMYNKKVEIVDNVEIAPAHHKIILESLEISREAQPGQFIHVRVSENFHPLLRRPFSIHKIDKENQCIEILFNIVGRGTLLLSRKKKGEYLDVIGPLGRGYWLTEDTKEVVIVAGGIGIAPLFSLAENLVRKNILSSHIIAMLGAETKNLLVCVEELRNLGVKVEVATKDGSAGYNGMVSTLLENYLSSERINQRMQIFSCGPLSMLKIVAKIAHKYNLPCQVSMEEKMGCGIGACLGCVIKVREKGSLAEDYERVCVNGPVFDAYEVIWE